MFDLILQAEKTMINVNGRCARELRRELARVIQYIEYIQCSDVARLARTYVHTRCTASELIELNVN